MLKVVRKRWLSWDFTVMEGPRVLADSDVSWWRKKGVLTVQGVNYRVYREGLMSGDFILESAGSVLARAVKPSAFGRSFIIDHKRKQYTLRQESGLAFRGAFALLDGPLQIGSLAPDGALMRTATVVLPDHLPLPVKVFTVWLTFILWRWEGFASPGAT